MLPLNSFEGLFKPGSRHNLVWTPGSECGNVPGKQGHEVTKCKSNSVLTANAEILKEQTLTGEPVEGERKRPASWPWQMSDEGTGLTLRKTLEDHLVNLREGEQVFLATQNLAWREQQVLPSEEVRGCSTWPLENLKRTGTRQVTRPYSSWQEGDRKL